MKIKGNANRIILDKKVIQEKENIIYESEIKDFVEQNSSIPDIKKEATIPIKTEYKVKKERKFIMPKINIPMSVRIAIISSVLLVIGVGDSAYIIFIKK